MKCTSKLYLSLSSDASLNYMFTKYPYKLNKTSCILMIFPFINLYEDEVSYAYEIYILVSVHMVCFASTGLHGPEVPF